MNRRLPLVPNEQAALRRAEAWVAALDDGYGRAGINAADPAAAPLHDMDRDLRQWTAAVRRGYHDARSFRACARCLTWTQEFERMQSTANTRRRGVTRALLR